jgi:hypothetical protein
MGNVAFIFIPQADMVPYVVRILYHLAIISI